MNCEASLLLNSFCHRGLFCAVRTKWCSSQKWRGLFPLYAVCRKKNKLPIDSAAYPISFVQLFSLGCSYGAGICASAAVDALGSVDSVNVTGRDSLYGAAVCASAASDALISIDLISHWSCSSLYVIGKPGTLSGHTAPTVLYHIPHKKSIDFTGIMWFAAANFCGSYGVSDTFSFMLPAYSPFRPEKDAANMHDRILLFKCFGELDTKPHFYFPKPLEIAVNIIYNSYNELYKSRRKETDKCEKTK